MSLSIFEIFTIFVFQFYTSDNSSQCWSSWIWHIFCVPISCNWYTSPNQPDSLISSSSLKHVGFQSRTRATWQSRNCVKWCHQAIWFKLMLEKISSLRQEIRSLLPKKNVSVVAFFKECCSELEARAVQSCNLLRMRPQFLLCRATYKIIDLRGRDTNSNTVQWNPKKTGKLMEK